MTDHDDDEEEAAGIPVRLERTDPEGHVTESGPHVTGSGRHTTGSGRHTTGSGRHTTGSGRHTTGSGRHTTGSGRHASDSGPHVTESGPHTTDSGSHATDSGRHTTELDSHTTDSGAAVAESGRHVTESGRHVTESGRHVTNRNIVPRAVTREPGGRPDLPEDDFDAVTPVRPLPHDPFEHEAATRPLGNDDAPENLGATVGGRSTRALHRADTLPGRGPRTPARAWTDRASVPASLDYALRAAAIVAVLGLGVAGIAQPESALRGGIAWLAFLFFVLAGWGTLVARIARAGDPDGGVRAALGAAGYLAIAGVLVAAGVLNRPAILILIGLGFAGFAWRELTTPVASWHRLRDAAGFVRANPALGVVVGALGAVACARMLAAVAGTTPLDGAGAAPLVKRLLDAGNLVEPFSFHRLTAYGGQTALQALGAARGSLANPHLIDHGLGLGLALIVIVDYARQRGTQPLWIALIALVVVVLPDPSLDTASAWTGVVAFLALYRSAVREQWALVGLVAAVTCALHHSLVAVAVVFVASVLGSRLAGLARAMPLREAWHEERRAWAVVAGVALAVIVPWWIAAHASSHNFLFPLVGGTWNHGLSLGPAVTTWTQELAYLVACCADTFPIVVLPLLALVLAFATDHRPGRPLASLAIASAFGVVVLAHILAGGEPAQLWRHAFGFAVALAIVMVVEIGADDDGQVGVVPLGRWLVLAALVLQLVGARRGLPARALALGDDIRAAAAIDRDGDPGARADQRRYRAMQAALPAGAAAIAMVDAPGLLDYRRNSIANLDVAGLASPETGLPWFTGAEPLRAYLVAQGYRYAAIARADRAGVRRAREVHRLFSGSERRQLLAAYAVDAIDSFGELAATTAVVYDDDGLAVLDLGRPLRDASRRQTRGDEPALRAAWVRELADREGLHDAWSLTSRGDLRFEDGTGAPNTDVPRSNATPRAPPEVAPRGAASAELDRQLGRPVRRRAHLRVRGATDMRLVLHAQLAPGIGEMRPRLDVSLDGELLASELASPGGQYAIDVTVPRGQLAGGWHDVYLVFSGVAAPVDRPTEDQIDHHSDAAGSAPQDPGIPAVARLEAVEWAAP
jgi:hypothetical protein